MKNSLIAFVLILTSTLSLQAQTPQGFNYQATVRNADGALIVNQNVNFRFNIQQGSATSNPVFTETHFVSPDDLGQVNLIIGDGTAVTGNFTLIDWSLGSYFLGIELNTGAGYIAMGTTQLLSVPYALYAENSGNATPTMPNLEAVLAENNSANNQQIKDLADPTDDQDAVTKIYTYSKAEVDELLTALNEKIDLLENLGGLGTVTDIDGNTYDYLTYGAQKWTVENAEMVTYRDGTPIPEVNGATEWSNLTTGAWAYYDNDPSKHRLYNWYAVMGIHDTDDSTPNKEFAPEGWHVPSNTEWTTLEDQLIAYGYNYDGTITGNKIAQAMASIGWNASTVTGSPGNYQSANNDSGFNAVPEGYRNFDGSFEYDGWDAFFWSSTENSADYAWYRVLFNASTKLHRSYVYGKQYGFSVRFVRGEAVDSNEIDDDGDGYTENQGDCDDDNASVSPGAEDLTDGIDNNCDGIVDNQVDEISNLLTGASTVDDIGSSQTWYWQSDKYMHIGLGPVTDDYGGGEFAWPNWWNSIQPNDPEKSCMYTNEFVFTNTANGLTFEQTVGPAYIPGAYADVIGVTGDICHDETVATTMFGIKNVAFSPSTSKAAVEGSYGDVPYTMTSFQLSEGGFMGWYIGETVYDIISISATELHVRFIQEGGGFAWYAKYQTEKPISHLDIDDDNDGFTENEGDCDDTDASINPAATEIEDNIDNDCDGEIDEGFGESGTVIDVDGNTYNYLSYGTQAWTVDNAAMETYRDGTTIPQQSFDTEWSDLTTGAWCYYDNDEAKGKLYNWYAVMGIHDTDESTPNKEFAPEGWHVPSIDEWTTLENYLIANGYSYDQTNTGNKIAKAMASITGWNSSTNPGRVGNDQSLNNSSGFNGFPEGSRFYDGSFKDEGNDASFWSSTEYADLARYRNLNVNSSYLDRLYSFKRDGLSVRFIRN